MSAAGQPRSVNAIPRGEAMAAAARASSFVSSTMGSPNSRPESLRRIVSTQCVYVASSMKPVSGENALPGTESAQVARRERAAARQPRRVRARR